MIEEWYLRKDVIDFFLDYSKNREVVPLFKDGNFGKRPFTIQYEEDIKELIAKNVVSFHCSAERWLNVSSLIPNMSKEDLDNLRIGFDLIIDPDTKNFDIAKITIKTIIEALKDFSVKNFLLKFSGGKSFHIIIPFESFPKQINFEETSKMYIEIVRKIIEFLKYYCKPFLTQAILQKFDISDLCEIYQLEMNKLIEENGYFNPYSIINLDIFGVRHLYRMPYSLHEKTFLVSLPIDYNKVDKFQKEDARIESIKDVEKIKFKEEYDAELLLIEALDWSEKHKELFKEREIEIKKISEKKVKSRREIKEIYFPPCIKKILNGVNDGRKRGLFLLVNFLRIVGYSNERILEILKEWNKKNSNPLPENYLLRQAKYYLEKRESPYIMPSCNRSEYYDNTNFCNPDEICQNKLIKNPLNYPFKKMKHDKSN